MTEPTSRPGRAILSCKALAPWPRGPPGGFFYQPNGAVALTSSINYTVIVELVQWYHEGGTRPLNPSSRCRFTPDCCRSVCSAVRNKSAPKVNPSGLSEHYQGCEGRSEGSGLRRLLPRDLPPCLPGGATSLARRKRRRGCGTRGHDASVRTLAETAVASLPRCLGSSRRDQRSPWRATSGRAQVRSSEAG